MIRLAPIIFAVVFLFTPAFSFARETLQSNFFKKDTTAKSVIEGKAFSYINTINRDGTISLNSFTWKFLNGMRQAGYTETSSLLPRTESGFANVFHKFQELNKLSRSDIIDANTLSRLDTLLVEREKRDSVLSASFPLKKQMVRGVSTEPSPEHVSALFALALSSLPAHIAKMSSENILNFIQIQGPGGDAGGIQQTPKGICFLNYYTSLNSDCNTVNTLGIGSLLKTDVSLVYNILHEYAHYIDGKIYFSSSKRTNVGAIDTSGFTKISYSTATNCNPSSNWGFFKLTRPQDIKNEFVTNYAVGYSLDADSTCRSSVEDFADSFAMYVMQGNVFRELAKTKPVIAQKYVWLKKNVFKNKEYNTGDISNIANVAKALSAPYQPILPEFADYLTINPNFIWNYTLPLKTVSKTIAPTQNNR